MWVFGGVKSDSMNQVDKVMDSHQVKHKGGNFSEVGGVLSDSNGLFKPKGGKIVGKKAVKEVWSTKPYDRSSLSLVEDKAALYSSSSFYESLEEGQCLNFKNFEGEQSCWPTQHGSRKNMPQNGRPGCDGSVPFKNLQTSHRGKGFGGFKDFKVGFRKVDGKSLEPSKLELASPSLLDVGFGSKEKSQEGKVSVNLKHLSPVLTPNWSSCLAVKGHVMKCRNFKNNFKLSLNLEDEISRIVRIGVALGLDFDGKKVGMAAVFAEFKRKLKLGGL